MATTRSKIIFQILWPAFFAGAAFLPPLGPGTMEGLFRDFPELCFFHRWTGLDCPGCGLTRSMLSFFSFNLELSFFYHPLGPVLGIAGTLLWVCSFRENFWTRAMAVAFGSWWRNYAVGILAVVVSWGIWRNL